MHFLNTFTKETLNFMFFFLKSSLLYTILLYKQNLVLNISLDIANFQGIIWLYIWISTITLDI